MADPADTVQGLLQEAASLLRFQADLGLRGLDVAPTCLTGASPPASRAAPRAVNLAPTAPVTEEVPSLPADPGQALRILRDHIGDCQRCKLAKGRTSVVFGVGNPHAQLMFVGEGPGRDEDLQGEPFVGEAGKLLNRMIGAMGLKREEIYIANIVKCRPPRNRDPEPDEVAACEPFLKTQIATLRPQVLVALGRYAAQTLLRDSTPISRMRGRWRAYQGIDLMPTFHPAYLLRNPGDKRLVWQDLQAVMQKLGLPGTKA
ncbi:MAG TPA: uracil-DNA glycosylase [Myxococcota bacterium]|nr:uracil-DNA glycosylase [Myxococcota bacterium]